MSSKDILNEIIDYEAGILGLEQTVRMFGTLLESGTALALQGHYGRTAHRLIESGVLSSNGTVDEDVLAEWLEDIE